MTEFKVVGLNYENRKEILKRIINSYKSKGDLVSWEGLTDKQIIDDGMEGYEFESQFLRGAITLQKEPTNKYDPNAIKVYMSDATNKKHLIGYIPKEKTKEVAQLMKRTSRIDAEVTGGGYKAVDDGTVETEFLDAGINIHMIDIVEATKNNPFVKAGDGTTKTKVTNRIGCGLMLFIVLIVIIIIVT